MENCLSRGKSDTATASATVPTNAATETRWVMLGRLKRKKALGNFLHRDHFRQHCLHRRNFSRSLWWASPPPPPAPTFVGIHSGRLISCHRRDASVAALSIPVGVGVHRYRHCRCAPLPLWSVSTANAGIGVHRYRCYWCAPLPPLSLCTATAIVVVHRYCRFW